MPGHMINELFVAGRNSLSVFFKVKVQPSTSEDLQSIVKEWHPSLELLAAKLTGVS